MTKTPKDLEQLIHGTLENLGWQADPKEVADRVKRLNYGLPVEDEFIVLCSWLNQCNIIHKLDQQQMPPASTKSVQVPDVLAQFEVEGDDVTVLIEVKSSHKNVLSFKPDYYEKLLEYGKVIGLPVLVAWKNKLGFWSLFDLGEMKKAKKNFNITFQDALRENLLGVLAGDFVYGMHEKSHLSLTFSKEKLVNHEKANGKEEQTWMTRVTDVSFYDGGSNKITMPSSEIQSIFRTIEIDEEEFHSEKEIIVKFFPKPGIAYFAHHALTRLLRFQLPDEEELSWRSHIVNGEIIGGVDKFKSVVTEAMKSKIVHHILNPIPHNFPEYIPLNLDKLQANKK